MKVHKILGILLIASLCAGCNPEQANQAGQNKGQEISQQQTQIKEQRCSTYDNAVEYIDEVKSMWADQNISEDDSTAQAFLKGFWGSFWKEHKTCPICQKNGHVPVE